MIFAYFIPALILFIIIFGIIKKVNIYQSFTTGAKEGFNFGINVFPFLLAIFVLTELFEKSGLSDLLCKLLSPLFNLFSIPEELYNLVLIKPFSGSGALATLSDIFTKYGVNSYISRCACVIYGSSETVFYISSVYFINVKNKKLFLPITISLIANFFSIIIACLLCKFI